MVKKKSKPRKDDGELDRKGRKILKLLFKNDRFGLFLGAGSGKSRILIRRLFAYLDANPKGNALVVSTKASILNTWPAELLQQMRVTGKSYPMHIHHPEYKQIVTPGVNCKFSARIIVVSYERLNRLLWHYTNNYFDFIALDESVRAKNWNSKTTRMVLTLAQQCTYRYPMAGLPAPNQIADLYTQVYIMDEGDRLGVNLTAFRRQFQEQSPHNHMVWYTRGWPDAAKMRQTEDEVLAKISDICVTEETESFVKNLTRPRYHTIKFAMKPKELKAYKKFQRTLIIELGPRPTIAESQAVLRGKLLQFVSGNLYDPQEEELLDDGRIRKLPRTWNRTTKERRKALEAWLNSTYKPGEKLIIAFSFQHNLPDILCVLYRRVDKSRVFVTKERKGQMTDLVKLWDAQRVDIIVSFAGTIGHSLNLQKFGGSVFLYSYTDNYDHFYQLLRRIMRRGNPKKYCDIYMLCGERTADELVLDNLRGKAELGHKVSNAASILNKIRKLFNF